jgi:glycerol dehydrogenase-like iron-containing ADH family enzyme
MVQGISCPMSTTVTLPAYTSGEDAYRRVADVVKSYGTSFVVIGGKRAMDAALGKLLNSTHGSPLKYLGKYLYGSEPSDVNVEKLAKIEKIVQADMLFAMGGGKAIDTVKSLGKKLGKPVFTFPTIASTCAASTAISVMYDTHGVFSHVEKLGKPPLHIFIDSTIIGNAPAIYLWAGIGDTLAKHVEVSFAGKNDALMHSDDLATTISRMCVWPHLTFGAQAIQEASNHQPGEAVNQVVLNNIISTGFVSILVDPKYNGALAHSLFYGMTLLPEIEKNHLHGEVVAYGVLVQLLMDHQSELFEELYPFYKLIHLPVCLKDLGLKADREQFVAVLDKTVNGPELEYSPYPITQDMVYLAMMKLEEKSISSKGEKQ